MARQKKEPGEQGKSQAPSSDFSKQIDTATRQRMKGEHSLQVDHDGQSFQQSEQGQPEGSTRPASSKSSKGAKPARASKAEQAASSADFTVGKVSDADSAPGGG